MKCLVVGDIHIKLDNLSDIHLFIRKLEQEIKNRQPNFIILLGDVLHTHERIHTSCLQHAEELFAMCTNYSPTYVLVGNHDYISNSQFLTSNHWMTPFSRWRNLHIVDRVTDIQLTHEYRFIACPYVPEGRFIEALNTVENWKEATMIFGHQTLDGVKMGAIKTENVEEWLDTYPFLCSGHIHDKQVVQPNLYYTGTPMQQAFGESHHKTIVEFSWADGVRSQEEIELKVAIKRILYLTIEQAYTFHIQPEPYEMIRLTIKGTREECTIFKKTPAFRTLSQHTKIVFDEITVDQDKTDEVTSTFQEVLFQSIQSNFFLTKLYKQYAELPHTTELNFVV